MKDERFYKAYMEHRTVSRRGLLRGLLKGAQTVQQEQAVSEIKADVIRPPGAVAEVLFRQACTGCGDCVSACPESLIVLNGQRPEIDFLSNYCTRCEACIQACPTGVLHKTTFNINARPKLNHACQNSYMYCQSCADICQKNAIEWQINQPPILLNELCDGCAECAFVCPVNAFEMVIV